MSTPTSNIKSLSKNPQSPAALLKARVIASQTAEAKVSALMDAARKSGALREANELLSTAKAWMERNTKLVYEPASFVKIQVAEVLALIAAEEGFVVEQRFPEWGYVGVTIKIP